MTFKSITGNPTVRNAAGIVTAAGLIFAVILASQCGLISAGYEWLTQSLLELPQRVVTNLTSLPERLNPTWIESN